MNGNGYTMWVEKWRGFAKAKIIFTKDGWQRLMKDNVRYVCTDDFGYDLYEHNETGELFATNAELLK